MSIFFLGVSGSEKNNGHLGLLTTFNQYCHSVTVCLCYCICHCVCVCFWMSKLNSTHLDDLEKKSRPQYINIKILFLANCNG